VAFSLIGGLWVIMQIYSFIRQPTTSISASIDINDYVIPSEISDHFSYLSVYSIHDTLPSKKYRMTLSFFSIMAQKYGVLKIKNSGDKEIKEIEIETRNVYFEFYNNNGEYYSDFSNGRIIVGNLRPTQEVTVRLWGSSIYGNDIRITYPDGAITPVELKKVMGFYATISKIFPNPLIGFFFLGLMIFVIFSIFMAVKGMIDFEYFINRKKL